MFAVLVATVVWLARDLPRLREEWRKGTLLKHEGRLRWAEAKRRRAEVDRYARVVDVCVDVLRNRPVPLLSTDLLVAEVVGRTGEDVGYVLDVLGGRVR